MKSCFVGLGELVVSAALSLGLTGGLAVVGWLFLLRCLWVLTGGLAVVGWLLLLRCLWV